jgi:hypothetical protein
VPAHDALKEGESLVDTCNISSYSTIGSSGVFVILNTSADQLSGHGEVRSLGWDDIKDSAEFVKMLQSMVGVDKSSN